MSSAYDSIWTWAGGVGMSDVQMLKRTGDSTPPCGTPVFSCLCLDLLLLYRVQAFLHVVCYKLLYVLWYVSVVNFVDEFVDVYCVKCFAHIQSNDYCSIWGLFLVETCCDCVCYFMQCSCCGVIAFESVLVMYAGYVLGDFWKDCFFQGFDYG